MTEKREVLAKTVTLEMGKCLSQSLVEVDRCVGFIDYYIKNTEHFAEDEEVKTRFKRTFTTSQAYGTTLAIMPWNFPLYLPFKVALPAFVMGSPILLKHA